MPNSSKPVAIIVGAGPGLSASLLRRLTAEGYAVALAARDAAKLAGLAAETGALAFACDATVERDVGQLFEAVDAELGPPDVVIYNAAARVMGPIVDLRPGDVERVLLGNAMAGFLTAQAAARAMAPRASGTIVFTGASASSKGYPKSAPFAMGKFAIRGLAQSLARELGPAGIHVAHVIIDGAIRSAARSEPADRPDSMIDSAAIADLYLQIIKQPRSAWTHEVDIRAFAERF